MQMRDEASHVLSNLVAEALAETQNAFNKAIMEMEDWALASRLNEAFGLTVARAVEAGFALGFQAASNPAPFLFQEKAPTCVGSTDEGFTEDPYISELESISG